MKYYIPQEIKAYLQTNRSNIQGNLWSSFNLDLQTNLGAMRIANKLVTNTTSSDDSDLGRPTAFDYFDDRWWAICGTRIFKNSNEDLVSTFSEDTSTGFQTNYGSMYSDLAIFNDLLWSTTATTLYSKASGSGTGTWTSRDTLGSNVVHKLAYFKKFNRLYYTDTTSKISSIDTSFTAANSAGDYFIDLGTSVGIITTIVANSQNIWIGTTRVTNSATGNGITGTISEWDGISAQVTNDYQLNAAGCLAMTVYNDIPYAIDSEGRILRYSGSSFIEIGRLPINRTLLTGATTSTTANGRFVHFNGLVATKNNTLQVLINNLNDDDGDTINENLPSGIWELDLSTGNFTHRYSPTLKARSSSTVTDYGQNRILGAGALRLNSLTSDSASGRSSLICGFDYYSDATTTKSGIFIDSPANPTSPNNEGQKKGYFVSTWLESNEVVNEWNRIWSVYKKFRNASDNIEYKYRLSEEEPTYATITWTSTTTFTTTTDVSAYSPNATGFNGTVGGEVEVLQGTGSGDCVHVSSITENAGTYTVTLERAVTGVTGTAKARFQKWIKVFPAVPVDTVNSFSQFQIGGTDTRIQIKCCLTWTGDGEYYKSIITSNDKIIATA